MAKFGPDFCSATARLLSAALLLAASTAWGATNLWDEQVNGTLDGYPFAPTNSQYVIHPIGSAGDDINYVRGSILLIPTGPNFYTADEDAFWFTVPAGRQLTGLVLVETNTYSTYAWGSLYASATGPWDGTGQIGGWFAPNVPGTNDLFDLLGITSTLPSGIYSMNILPFPGVNNGYLLPGPDTVRYTLAILTEPVPSLEISRIESAVKLSWATNGANSFVLQSTTNPASISTWIPATNEVSVVGGRFVVTTPMLYDQQYFRLLMQ